MVNSNIVKNLLLDSESLSRYLEGETISIGDIKRRLFISERERDTRIPDQFYRLALDRDFKNIKAIEEIFCELLPGVANEYLDISTSEILVRGAKQNEWQEFITYLPPLLVKMALLHVKKPLLSIDPVTSKHYFQNLILPNALYTAIPSPKMPQLEELIAKENGLHDLHMHLNGSTEIDVAWQDFLLHPYKVYRELKRSFSNQMVREQLEEESYLLDPLKFYGLLRIANRIRNILFDLIYPTSLTPNYPSLKRLLSQIVYQDRYSSTLQAPVHPFQFLVYSSSEAPNLMAVEGLMYSIVLHQLKNRSNTTVTSLFHFYLLIQGLANRLLVQQVHQKGFEQFQKITLNGLRELSEKEYDRRFFQMHGNHLKFLRFLEGRFSPKKTEAENIVFIKKISDGWDKFKLELDKRNLPTPVLKLVPHFIKKKDSRPHDYIRYKLLRDDTWKKGKVLSLLIKRNYQKYSSILTGIDAASSEFDTPPEVFAPTYRALRRKKTFKHFTYHVGEDFFHLISGLRAIFEAIHFLDLQKGDRIGHGTATAICVKTWKGVVGESILIKKGEWLDNLIFIYHFATAYSLSSTKLHEISKRIIELANEIYAIPSVTIQELTTAWQLRKYCPILVFTDTHSMARLRATYDLDEWNDIQSENISTTEMKILELYNDRNNKAKYDEVISVKGDELLSLNELEELQKSLLKIIKGKEIVIETLPTSNVRIGYYKNYEAYHLNNWIKWKIEGREIPEIIVGTDDTGIFATNIFNEYANIWDYLIKTQTYTNIEIQDIVENLNRNSKHYRFT